MEVEWVCFPHLCAVSHIGARKNNEDGFTVGKLPDGYYLGIADGMGGHAAGEVASAIALETARKVVFSEYEAGMEGGLLKVLLKKSHELANSAVIENAVGDRAGMGTTLLTAVVRGHEVVVANTGDSRAQLIRNGNVVASTRDHSLVQKLLDEGVITEEEAWGHPASNRLVHVVGGSGRRFAVDLYRWIVEEGDMMLMSTDGLHDYVRREEILDVLSRGGEPRELVEAILERALPVTRDNVTIILYRW